MKHHASSPQNYLLRFQGNIPLIFINRCASSTIKTTIQRGYVRYVIRFEDNDRTSLAPLFGIFAYRHDYSIPFPYNRQGVPTHRLNLEDLPEKLQDIISWNWFDRIRFSKSRKLQPIEHMDCRTWNLKDGWVDIRGRHRSDRPHYRSHKL